MGSVIGNAGGKGWRDGETEGLGKAFCYTEVARSVPSMITLLSKSTPTHRTWLLYNCSFTSESIESLFYYRSLTSRFTFNGDQRKLMHFSDHFDKIEKSMDKTQRPISSGVEESRSCKKDSEKRAARAYAKSRPRIDMDFISAAKQRSNDAWSEIKKICEGSARRFLKEDEEGIEEIVSDAYTMLLENIEQYDPGKGKGNVEANFISWINKTVQLAFMHHREKRLSEKRVQALTDIVAAFGVGFDEEDIDPCEKGEEILSFQYWKIQEEENSPEYAVRRKQLYDAIAEFDRGRVGTAIVLHFIYGHTIKEIAEYLNEKESTINNWINRGRKRLAEYLKKKGIDEHFFDR